MTYVGNTRKKQGKSKYVLWKEAVIMVDIINILNNYILVKLDSV
jgi:hypothetical protein